MDRECQKRKSVSSSCYVISPEVQELANKMKKLVKEQEKRRNDKEILEALLSCEDPIKAVVMMQAERKRQAELIKDKDG